MTQLKGVDDNLYVLTVMVDDAEYFKDIDKIRISTKNRNHGYMDLTNSKKE